MAYETEIARLEEILNTGAQSVTVDGMMTTFNLAEVRHRLAELRRKQASRTGPRASTIKLDSGF